MIDCTDTVLKGKTIFRNVSSLCCSSIIDLKHVASSTLILHKIQRCNCWNKEYSIKVSNMDRAVYIYLPPYIIFRMHICQYVLYHICHCSSQTWKGPYADSMLNGHLNLCYGTFTANNLQWDICINIWSCE